MVTRRPATVLGGTNLDSRKAAGWRSRALTFITDLYGENGKYLKEFGDKTEKYAYAYAASAGIGILEAIKSDMEAGYMQSYRQLVAADLFSDFFEQAEHLHSNGYHQAAASLAGAALENGLKEIARSQDITLGIKEDLSTLSGKLADRGVISRLEQKQLSAMADIRNGRYSQRRRPRGIR